MKRKHTKSSAGRIGGKSGVGASKTRPRDHYVAAGKLGAQARTAKRSAASS